MQNQSLLRDASARSSTLSLFGSLDLSFTRATSVVLFSILIDMGKSVLERDLFLHYCLSSWLLRRSRVFSHFIWWLLNNTSTSGLRQKFRCIFRVRKIFVNVLCYCNVQFGYMISEATRLDRSFVLFFMMGSDKWKIWKKFLCQDFHQVSFERHDFDYIRAFFYIIRSIRVSFIFLFGYDRILPADYRIEREDWRLT